MKRVEYVEKLSVVIDLMENIDTFDECIESVRSYMGKDLEILIWAGKQSLNKNELFNEHCKKDKRIKIIYNESDNLSNEILKEITGKYVIFLESSDLLEINNFSKVMSIIKKSDNDIIMFNYDILMPNGNLKRFKSAFEDMHEFNDIKDEKLIKKLIIPNNPYIFKSIILNTEFIKNNNINIHSKIDLMSDLDLELSIFDKAASILFRDIHLFVYRVKSKVDDTKFDYSSFEMFENYCKTQTKYLTKWSGSKELLEEIYCYEFMLLSQMFFKTFEQSNEIDNVFSELKKIIKLDWVQNIISNVKSDKLNEDYRKRLAAFKVGKVRMIWILYKFKK